MKCKMNKKLICLAAVAMMLIAGVCVKDVMAYFTTYLIAQGKEELVLEFPATALSETEVDNQKVFKVENTGSADCYVRVRAIAPAKYGEIEAEGTGWTAQNGFYEYETVLKAGEETAEISIDLGQVEDESSIIVIQECTPVLYDEAGNEYAGWSDGDVTNDFVIE